MIEAGLEFGDRQVDRVVAAFVALPPPLRPVHFSHEEHVVRPADQVEDRGRFSAFLAKSQSGFFLLGQGVTYSIRIATGRSLICDCFINVEPEVAKQFLIQMSVAGPLFGFACSPGEREHRNRVTTRQGVNTTESWVGRDTNRYIPGLYWLTLLSSALIEQHGIALSALEAVARERIALEEGLNLFCFYERPEDWQKTSAVSELCSASPGIFDVDRIKPKLQAAKNFIELNSVLQNWK